MATDWLRRLKADMPRGERDRRTVLRAYAAIPLDTNRAWYVKRFLHVRHPPNRASPSVERARRCLAGLGHYLAELGPTVFENATQYDTDLAWAAVENKPRIHPVHGKLLDPFTDREWNSMRRCVHATAVWAFGQATADQMANFSAREEKRPFLLPRLLPRKHIDATLAILRGSNRALFILLAFTMMPFEEIRHLRVRHIVEKEPDIVVIRIPDEPWARYPRCVAVLALGDFVALYAKRLAENVGPDALLFGNRTRPMEPIPKTAANTVLSRWASKAKVPSFTVDNLKLTCEAYLHWRDDVHEYFIAQQQGVKKLDRIRDNRLEVDEAVAQGHDFPFIPEASDRPQRRGRVPCLSCGEEANAVGARFCADCGAELPPSPSHEAEWLVANLARDMRRLNEVIGCNNDQVAQEALRILQEEDRHDDK